MSATARFGAVLAVVVTFGVTAVLAVALTRGMPLPASLISVGHQTGHHAPRTTEHPVTEHPVTEHPVTEHPVTGNPVTGNPVTGPPVIDPGRSGSPVFTRDGTGENGSHEPQRDRNHARRVASPTRD